MSIPRKCHPADILGQRSFAQRTALAQKSSLFGLEKTVDFDDQFHKPFRVLLTGRLLAETQPALSCFTFHDINPPRCESTKWLGNGDFELANGWG